MFKKLQQSYSHFKGIPLILCVSVIILDQLSKIMVENASQGSLAYKKEIIPNFFSIRFVYNEGAAWGMFSDYTFILAIISLVAFIYFLWNFEYLSENDTLQKYSLGIVLGGIFGNFIDRAFRGRVIDMLNLDNIFGYTSYPTFNIADMAICIGIVFIIIRSFFLQKSNAK